MFLNKLTTSSMSSYSFIVVCNSYLSEKTYGENEKWGKYRRFALAFAICHLGLYFFCCGVNDRLGGVRGTVQGYFWNFIPKG